MSAKFRQPWFMFVIFLSTLLSTTVLPGQEASEEAADKPTPTTTVDPRIPLEQLKVLVKPLTKEELQVEADGWMKLLRQKAKQVAAVRLGVQKTNEALATDDEEEAQTAMEAAETIQEQAAVEAAAAEAELTQSAQSDSQVQTEGSTGESPPAVEPAERPAEAAQGEDLETAASAQKEELLENVNLLQDERTALADRLKVVLASLEAKGGDVQSYRDYATAISGLEIDTNDVNATWSAITGWLTSKEGGQRWAMNLLRFVAILFVSYLVARIVAWVVNWLLERKVKLSTLAEKLVSRTIKDVMMVIGFAIALTALEIDITPIIAAIGAAGFIIGFALQGTLSNFASGLMILLNRPFDEGDVVTAGGITGKVDQMNLVSTTFRTFDNQTIHVPNNEIWGSVITNITANENRRVDMEFGIGYEDDFEEAERIIGEVVASHELVLEDPEPMVVMHELGDSCVMIVCRPWAKTSDWWTVKTEVTRRVKQRFDELGISIPYPQRDVHVYQHLEAAAATAGK